MPEANGKSHFDRDDGSCLGLPPGHNRNAGTSKCRRGGGKSGEVDKSSKGPCLRKKSTPGLPQSALLTVLACAQGASVAGAAVGHGYLGR